MLLKAAKTMRAEERAPHQYSGLRLESVPDEFLQAEAYLEQAGEGGPSATRRRRGKRRANVKEGSQGRQNGRTERGKRSEGHAFLRNANRHMILHNWEHSSSALLDRCSSAAVFCCSMFPQPHAPLTRRPVSHVHGNKAR